MDKVFVNWILAGGRSADARPSLFKIILIEFDRGITNWNTFVEETIGEMTTV